MRLDETARAQFVADHPGWAIEGEELRRTFEFDGFPAAIAFVNRVAFVAEAADHHPDVDIRWNKVSLVLSTHSEGVLTSKDTDLATEIDAI